MKNYLLLFLLILYISPSAQDDSGKLYDDSQVARIDVSIAPSALDWIYDNVESDSLHLASMRFKNQFIDEQIDSIGFRIRGNTSRQSSKKSFKISFNTFVNGREFYGVDKLNLNGEHNDPSIARAKICWDFFQQIGLAASRASYTELYINGKYYGLYLSVEHVDKDFLEKNFTDASGNLWKCLYPADLRYLGSDPTLYKLEDNNRPVYELKTNEDEDDYSQLARFINVLNNTPLSSFQDSIENILNVAGVLKYFAMNILTGSWDDYWSLKNNYYLYHSPSEDKFHMIPYDYDNTFGIDWFNIDWANADPYNFPKISGGSRPLVEKLLAIPQYKNLYTHFIEFYRENIFKLSNWEAKADAIRNMISTSAVPDSFRTLDYGFTMNDFNNSYSTGYSNQHVKRGIKEFANIRYGSLSGKLSYSNAAPIVYRMDWHPKNPSAADSVYVTISAFGNAPIEEASIRFIPTGSSVFIDFPLIFSPVLETKKIEEADTWAGVIPPLGSGNSGSFKILLKDANQFSAVYPRGEAVLLEAYQNVSGLVINEFLPSNAAVIADEYGEYDDWLEIYNSTDEEILLSGMYLSDKPDNLTKWKFPDGIAIGPKQFVLVWCDEDGSQGDLHANFKLSNDGEFAALTAADGITIVDSISFGFIDTDISMGRLPDGTDNWQFFSEPTPGYSNSVTDISEESSAFPSSYSLNAFPNPFNPATTISFQIVSEEFVTLKVYDVIGNETAVLVNEKMAAGSYNISFNAERMASGVYFYRLDTPNFTETKKLILLK